MGSPLGLSLVNAFLACHKQNWLDACPLEYRQLYYQLYPNMLICLYFSDHFTRFQSHLNASHVNISFAVETKYYSEMSMLLVNRVDLNKFLSKTNFQWCIQ